MIDLNLTLHDLQKVKTKCALKIDDEDFMKAKSEATRKIRKLSKVYGAWLPPWLVSRLVVYQPYVKNHCKEFMFIQGRIWDPGIKIVFRQHLEGNVVSEEWGMLRPRLLKRVGPNGPLISSILFVKSSPRSIKRVIIAIIGPFSYYGFTLPVSINTLCTLSL
ncbi:hypothetical protein Tco_0281627 [Tanacetum coccineum]